MSSAKKRRRDGDGGDDVEELKEQLQKEQLHHQMALLKLREEEEKQTRLSRNLQFQQQQNEEHIRDRAKEREEAVKVRYELESKQRASEKLVRELREQLGASESQMRELDSALQHEKESANSVRDDSTDTRQRNTELQARVEELQQTLQEMCRQGPSQAASLGAAVPHSDCVAGAASGDATDVTGLREELRSKERQVRELERVVKTQRAELANEQLLRQQVAELKEQRDRARTGSASHVETQENLKAFSKQRQSFAEAFAAFEVESGGGAATAAVPSAAAASTDLSQLQDDVMRTLHRMRREQLRVMQSEGKWKTGKQEAERQRNSAQEQLRAESRRRKDAESGAAEQTAKADGLVKLNEQLGRKCERLQSTLRQLDASLENVTASDNSAAGDALAQKDRRIAALETQLAETEQCAEAARSEAEKLVPREVLTKEAERVQELQNEAAALQEKVLGLEKALERSETENAAMDLRLGRGEFNPATTKVVHFANNPTTQAQERVVANLRREIEDLTAQLAERAQSFKSGLTPGSAMHKPRESASDRGQAAADPAVHTHRLKQVCLAACLCAAVTAQEKSPLHQSHQPAAYSLLA